MSNTTSAWALCAPSGRPWRVALGDEDAALEYFLVELDREKRWAQKLRGCPDAKFLDAMRRRGWTIRRATVIPEDE